MARVPSEDDQRIGREGRNRVVVAVVRHRFNKIVKIRDSQLFDKGRSIDDPTSRMIISMTIGRIDSGSVFGKATTFVIRFHANGEIAPPFKDESGQKLRILILDLAICCVKLNAKVVSLAAAFIAETDTYRMLQKWYSLKV